MRSPAALALLIAGLATALLGVLHWLGVGFLMLVALAVVSGLVAALTPWIGVRWWDALEMHWRRARWHHEAGRHHAFAGISLFVVDDGRAVWIDGADLQRVLKTRDADDVLAARHAGRWRRDERGRLMLRVDAVVQHLSSAPGRMDPRTVHLRRYLERELLYPAQQRRRLAR